MKPSDENKHVLAKERGDSLESAIEHIFKVAGFQTEQNVFIAKYEIDVKATIGDRTIVIECKNYQNSNLTIRNLIHQWNSKNQLIGAHKIILVLAGLNIKDSDLALASEFNMEIWDQDDITELFNLSLKPDELRERLLTKISLKPLKISERYRDEITYLVIKPLLSSSRIEDERLYWFFNKWLRAHIITELQMIDTSPLERSKHIELFEGTKTRKKEGFLNISKKRKEVDYWETVYAKLKDEEILSREQQDTYITYMNDIFEEYRTQQQFFEAGDYNKRLKKLISSRLQNALYHGEDCKFRSTQRQNTILVKRMDIEAFMIHVSSITEGQANILNWILTSEYTKIVDDSNNSERYYWRSSSFNETSEKVYRIFTEYFVVAENEAIYDISLT